MRILILKDISGKKYIGCKIFGMQGLYPSMWWELITLTFHKESFVLGQKTIYHLSQVMTLLMKVNQKIKQTVSSHWQIPKNTPVTKKYTCDQKIHLWPKSVFDSWIKITGISEILCALWKHADIIQRIEKYWQSANFITEIQQRYFGFYWVFYFLWCF